MLDVKYIRANSSALRASSILYRRGQSTEHKRLQIFEQHFLQVIIDCCFLNGKPSDSPKAYIQLTAQLPLSMH
jgi:hypothetical protein